MPSRPSPRQLLPSVVTFLGHLLTLGWLAGGPAALALLGLLCDAADGALARRLRVQSETGGLYDWLVDVTTACLVMQRLGALPLLLVLVPTQAILRQRGARVSGRVAVVLFTLVWESFR